MNRTKNAVVRARIDRELKRRAEHVLEAMDLTVSDVLREVIIRVATGKKLPFKVRTALGGQRDVKFKSIDEEQFWAQKRTLQLSDTRKAELGSLQPGETLLIPARMLKGAEAQWPEDSFAECEVEF